MSGAIETSETREAREVAGAANAPEMAITARRFTGLDAAMLGVLALVVIPSDVAAAWLGAGWITAWVTLALTAGALGAVALRPAWRPLILRLLALGLVIGIVELFTDFSGEFVASSLIYPPHEPMIWASPAYMPFSWSVTLTLIGYLAWRLWRLAPRPPRWAAILLTGLWGAVNIPFYEEMAYHAGWWRYATAPGLGHTPWYVILFEGLLAALMPPLVARLETRRWWDVALRGLALGAWAPWAALFAWLLVGR
jgi:uncharacterized protein DUF6989